MSEPLERYRISLMSRIIDREKFLDNCIHTFLSVHSDIQQPYTCTIYTRVLVYRYRFEHARYCFEHAHKHPDAVGCTDAPAAA